jgi:hypothetical protein
VIGRNNGANAQSRVGSKPALAVKTRNKAESKPGRAVSTKSKTGSEPNRAGKTQTKLAKKPDRGGKAVGSAAGAAAAGVATKAQVEVKAIAAGVAVTNWIASGGGNENASVTPNVKIIDQSRMLT